MPISMTGFSRIDIKKDWGDAVWEIRSVNNRFLDTTFRLPEQVKILENILRDKIKLFVYRGKIDINLRLDLNKNLSNQLQINLPYTETIIKNLELLKNLTNQGHIELVDLLKMPGVIEQQEIDYTKINQDLLSSFDSLINDFVTMKQREGEAIGIILEQKLKDITVEIKSIINKTPLIIEWQRNKILQKFEELNLEIDKTRLEQEMIFFIQKTDICEELDRLKTHVSEIRKILKQDNIIGRKLDFMMQELNREANTLTSKSLDKDITNSAVNLKVLIEQMREQIQNLE